MLDNTHKGIQRRRNVPLHITSEPGLVGAWWSKPVEVPLRVAG